MYIYILHTLNKNKESTFYFSIYTISIIHILYVCNSFFCTLYIYIYIYKYTYACRSFTHVCPLHVFVFGNMFVLNNMFVFGSMFVLGNMFSYSAKYMNGPITNILCESDIYILFFDLLFVFFCFGNVR